MIEATSLEVQRKRRIEEAEEARIVAETQLETQLPVPVGYRLLVAMPTPKETFGDTQIAKSETTLKHDVILSMVGLVLDMGEQAYRDPDRYPLGPWCRKGDFVMFRANSGTRFKVQGKEYRLINDDTVEGVVADPNGIQRVN